MLVGAITGPIYDAGYARELLIFGSVLTVTGLMLLSICERIGRLYFHRLFVWAWALELYSCPVLPLFPRTLQPNLQQPWV